MKAESLVGLIGSMHGYADKEVLKGDMAASFARISLRPVSRLCVSSSQFLMGYQTQIRSMANREWVSVPRDHSRSRHGNRRGY